MQILDYTLNNMSLLALALAMGNLVDDAICMIENIDQHTQMGKKPFQAALDASAEIGLAVVATTATIVAVFLPVAFMGGSPRSILPAFWGNGSSFYHVFHIGCLYYDTNVRSAVVEVETVSKFFIFQW
ncbi:hypothetical protein CYANOKiyG1_55740 [Okeania sp. KiyG1]|nr:hypothetical protein CYANOKiyG1_55740 [Okeania sp. KiyG1]